MGTILDKILNKFTFFPHNKMVVKKEDMPDYVAEKWINTPDGNKLQAFFLEHKSDKKRPLILYFHGNTGNVFSHHRFQHALKLYAMNHNVLMLSYRGYLRSTGSPSEQGIYMDGESALEYAKQELGYTEEEVFVFGRSLGSTVATHISQHRNFKGVVLITPLTSAKEMAVAMGFRYFSWFVKKSFNSIKKIKNLKSKLLIIHGDDDKQIPVKMGEKLYHKYKGKKQLIIIKNGGHNNIQQVDPSAFWNGINSFLNH